MQRGGMKYRRVKAASLTQQGPWKRAWKMEDLLVQCPAHTGNDSANSQEPADVEGMKGQLLPSV